MDEAAVAEQEYQAKFHRVFKHMIDRLGQPLVTAEATLNRVHADMGTCPPPTPSPSLQPRTEQGQLIYQTLSQAEQVHQSLLLLEQVLLQRKEARMGAVPAGTGTSGGSAFAGWAAPSLGEAEWGSGSDDQQEPIPAYEVEEAEKKAPVAEYNFREMDSLSVPYTQMGLMTTVPDQKGLAKKAQQQQGEAVVKKDVIGGLETDWDAPCRAKMQKIPWNCKVPITLTVNIPRKRYFAGDKMELHVEIHNMTEKKIKQLTCTLIKKSTSYVLSQGLRNVNSKKDEEVINLEVSPLGFPVKGRFRYQNRVFFKLPFTLAPTVSDGQSSFEVVYYLKVRTGTARKNGPFVVLGPLKIEQRRI